MNESSGELMSVHAKSGQTEARADAFPGLDLVRFGAALLVAVYHLGFWCWKDMPSFQMPRLIPFVASGWVGVEIFFVLSGFVIAFSARGKTAPQFIRSRAMRLYPAVWVCATITILVTPADAFTYLRSITLFPIGPWVEGAYWTLPIEMAFYLLVALAIWRAWPLRNLALGLGFYSALFWLLKIANLGLHFADFSIIENNPGYILLAHFGVFFAFGVLLYERRYPYAAVTFALFALLATSWRSHAMHIAGDPFYIAPIIWLVAAMLIVAVAMWNPPIARLPTRTLGLMTYPLYLLHKEVGRAIMLFIGSPAIGLFIALGVVVWISCAVVRMEKVIRHALRWPSRLGPASLP